MIMSYTSFLDFKKKPLTFKTAKLLLDTYDIFDHFIEDDYLAENQFEGSAECKEMRKPVDLAIRGMQGYTKYLETVYEETGIYRDDQTNFQYQKYPELYEKKNKTCSA